MSNTTVITGRIARDPELKSVGQTQVLEFTLADNVGFGDKKTTNWFRCSLWGKRGVTLSEMLTNGREVVVAGEITIREYQNKEGVTKYSNDVNVYNLTLVGNKTEGALSKPAAPVEEELDVPF